MKRNTLVAIAGFVLGGIIVATGVVAAPTTPKDHKPLDRAACKHELARAGLSSRGSLSRPEREPRVMFLLAVDRRLNGCRVLSPASAWSDVVPEPNVGEAPAGRQPAVGG